MENLESSFQTTHLIGFGQNSIDIFIYNTVYFLIQEIRLKIAKVGKRNEI